MVLFGIGFDGRSLKHSNKLCVVRILFSLVPSANEQRFFDLLRAELTLAKISSTAMARRKMSDVEALEEIFRSDVELEDSSDSWWDSDEEEEEEPDTADRLDLGDV